MKHDDVYKLISNKVGLKEDQEYRDYFNPKDLYGESLQYLAVRNFKRFIAVIYYLIKERDIKFDLVIGPGDSGIGLAKITEMIYQTCNIDSPKVVNMPIARFVYGFGLYDNSILIPEIEKQLKDFEKLEQVLIVDDEIGKGVALSAAIKVILQSVNSTKIKLPLEVTLVAEDQDFKTDGFMDSVNIEMYSFAKSIEGMFSVVSYIVPWSIEQKIREHFDDTQIGSKVLVNILLDLPVKEKELVKDIMLPVAKFTYKNNEMVKSTIPNFEKLQREFKSLLYKLISEAIEEYNS